MRSRDPRRLVRRRARARARVTIVETVAAHSPDDGSVTSRQTAQVTLPRSELDRIWTAEYLERLARTYWHFLTGASLRLLRVLYTTESREIALLGRPLVLLRFHAPEYEAGPGHGTVTWRIERGLLVAPAGRGQGFLRISVARPDIAEGEGPGEMMDGAERPDGVTAGAASDEITATVVAEVASFYPLIAGWGWFAHVGRLIYRETQLRIHVIVTNAFLRSLANLDLVPSIVGALARPPADRSYP